MIHVALIGVTGYAATHLSFLRASAKEGRLRLCAATVINRPLAEEACRMLENEGCPIYKDHRDMLAACAGRIDLCVVPTAPHLHASMAVAALEAGAHVLLEKPLAPTQADIDAILAAERRTGRWVSVGFQDFYAPELASLCHRLSAGEWGSVRRVSGLCLWPRALEYYGRNAWAGRLHVDGRPVFDSPLSNAMAHFALIMLRLAAPAGRSLARLAEVNADLRRAYPIESFDTFALSARTADGVDFRFAGSHACARHRNAEIVVQAEEARIVWRQETSLTVETACGVGRIPITTSDTARRHQLEAVLARIHRPGTPVCTAQIAAEHARLYIDLHRAAAIRDVPSSEVVEEPRNGNRFRWIAGLEQELDAFVDHGPAAVAAS